MTIYKCDRCGKEQSTNLQVLKVSEFIGKDLSYDKDLCKWCINQLIEWSQPLPQESQENKQ